MSTHTLVDNVLQELAIDLKGCCTVDSSVGLRLGFSVFVLDIPIPFEWRPL